jgi:hypothetical protein
MRQSINKIASLVGLGAVEATPQAQLFRFYWWMLRGARVTDRNGDDIRLSGSWKLFVPKLMDLYTQMKMRYSGDVVETEYKAVMTTTWIPSGSNGDKIRINRRYFPVTWTTKRHKGEFATVRLAGHISLVK